MSKFGIFISQFFRLNKKFSFRVYDGSEVHESSAACVAITRAGKEVAFYAPDKDQHHVINHVSGEADEDATRNVVIESGRIARGKVNSLAVISPQVTVKVHIGNLCHHSCRS